jgi:hypothetical protein
VPLLLKLGEATDPPLVAPLLYVEPPLVLYVGLEFSIPVLLDGRVAAAEPTFRLPVAAELATRFLVPEL